MIFKHFPLKELLKGLIVFSKSTSVWCLQKNRERRVFGVERRAAAKSKVQYHILSEKNQELSETPTDTCKNGLIFFGTTMSQIEAHLLLGAKDGSQAFRPDLVNNTGNRGLVPSADKVEIKHQCFTDVLNCFYLHAVNNPVRS